jgi:hypothetical protein
MGAFPSNLSFAADNFFLARLPHMFAEVRCTLVFQKALCRELPERSGLMIHALHIVYPVLPLAVQCSI